MSAHDRANRLYWESDASVNDIADRLDLSKGALYQLIEPLSAEVPCPDCGASLEYPNRTALERGLMQCSTCGRENVRSEETTPEPPVRAPVETVDPQRGSRDAIADRQGMVGLGLLGAAALLWMLRR